MFDYHLFESFRKTKSIGHTIKYFESIDSTNTQSWNLLERESNHGMVVITKNQTGGRGRRGAKWFSKENKSLTFSIILLNHKISNKSLLSLISGLSVIKAIKEISDLTCGLKWPNDIILDNKKLGGILIEANKKATVIGIGINVNEKLDELNNEIKEQSISLNIYNQTLIEIETLLAHVLNQFEVYCNQNKSEIINDWLEYCVHINKEIKFDNNNGIITAKFKGIGKNGEGIINVNGQDTIISGGIINL